MFKGVRKALVATAVTGMSFFAVAHAAELKELNFGIISTESSQNLKSHWDPFLADMSKQTGMKINAYFAPDYAGIIQGMRFDKVDVAWYGNKSAMEAVDRAGGEVFMQTVAADGKPGYWSLLIAHKDSPINSVEDMLKNAKDLNFGNGDPNSTSGFLVPGYYVFAKNNVEPKKIFKRTLNASHEVNALSVANKQVDVATFNTEGMDRLKDTNPEKAAQLKAIWKSPLIPSDPIVWRKNLPEETKQKILAFFKNYGANQQELDILAGLQWGKFRVSSNDQLLPIRQLELFKQRSQVVADTTLSDSDKQAKLATLDADLEELAVRMDELDKKLANAK
ncbi:phosphonate ABC transporter substrate-binding protein [Pollutimonas harenae]|uniref:Phosphonate ABC transporter substrate-binding protein n=1 Tax=Pollutimonas harenae TaxID=657015 RepID=A0A853GYN0_9BURK|nr:phosphonate ABC transporter substrate-binding protein [Pollutimonas harenae]NYT85836.1 phosphonate ABC transporter substrate-binding protein [Pollutimonas harenae]TEA70894.1 phosphonate ABC transporter substrate-binding protein [Pollutimonas harenae]